LNGVSETFEQSRLKYYPSKTNNFWRHIMRRLEMKSAKEILRLDAKGYD
jgi:hypothetical protein